MEGCNFQMSDSVSNEVGETAREVLDSLFFSPSTRHGWGEGKRAGQ